MSNDKRHYSPDGWDVKEWGDIPIPRQLEFITGDRRTTWIKMNNPTNEDREYFYGIFADFIVRLAEYHYIRLWSNQKPDNNVVGQYVPTRLIPHIVEWLISYGVGFTWGNWDKKKDT